MSGRLVEETVVDPEPVYFVVADYVDMIPTTTEQQMLRHGHPTNDHRATRLRKEVHEVRQRCMHLLRDNNSADDNANAHEVIAPGANDRSCSAGDACAGAASGTDESRALKPLPQHDCELLGDSTFAIPLGSCAAGTSEQVATHSVGGAVGDRAAPYGDA